MDFRVGSEAKDLNGPWAIDFPFLKAPWRPVGGHNSEHTFILGTRNPLLSHQL
jgi:hypothetical protein